MKQLFLADVTLEHPDFYFKVKDIELLLDSENLLFGFQILIYRLLELANNSNENFFGDKSLISKAFAILSNTAIKFNLENFKEDLIINFSNSEDCTIKLNCNIPKLNNFEFVATITQTNLLTNLLASANFVLS